MLRESKRCSERRIVFVSRTVTSTRRMNDDRRTSPMQYAFRYFAVAEAMNDDRRTSPMQSTVWPSNASGPIVSHYFF